MRAEELGELVPMAEVLARCAGMKKEDVYYLEQRGYLKPVKLRQGRVERNLFTKEQVSLVSEMWRLRQEGLPPREAFRRAKQSLSSGQLAIWPEREAASQETESPPDRDKPTTGGETP